MVQQVPGDAGASTGVGVAASDPDSHLRARLEARTRDILERPHAEPDPERAEQEKVVVRECRYLLRLLSTRRRSEGEMRQRLAEREVPGALVHEVIARIDRAGLLDDAAFAAEWVRQRRELRALGDEALRRELERKRVSPAHIEAALAAGADDEEERCRELVRSRIAETDRRRLRAERDGAHRRRLSRRLDALLTRKGYPGDLAVQVISSELREVARS